MAIVSHKYGFIFIKTMKTAGTAIETSLSPLCGPDDVVTPIFPQEPGHEARNFETSEGKFFNHMSMTAVRELVGPDIFRSYFKFCVEREPVDKCLSHFGMLLNSPSHRTATTPKSWDEYVERGNYPVDYAKYVDGDGALLVDRIVRYERLEDELSDVLRPLGLDWSGTSSRAKSGFRQAGVPARSDVTPDAVTKIHDAFRHPASLYL